MYNRYIPQPDGSYQRNRMQEQRQKPPPPPAFTNVPAAQEVTPRETPKSNSVPGFLKQLLPKGFDTGDLIVVLLLLLMAGDSPEDRSNAILTLALYFIM